MCLLRGTDLIVTHNTDYFSLLTRQTRFLWCRVETTRVKLVKCLNGGLGRYAKTARVIVSYKVSWI